MADEPENPFGAGGASEGMSEEEEAKAARAANRFDIRRLIGGLFLLYGLVLVITGIVGSSHVKNYADGINVDLWTGLGMLIFGALMVFWALARPTMPEPPKRSGAGAQRAPAT